jgi:hypothetical protein
MLWLARNWDANPPPNSTSDDFVSTAFFDAPTARSPAEKKPKQRPRAIVPVSVEQFRTVVPLTSSGVDGSTAITQPISPPTVDWARELGDTASDVIQKALQSAHRANTFSGRPEPSPSMAPLHEPRREYDWYARHSHQRINAHGVPEWVLIQPCPAEFLKDKPDCTVEHVEEHGVFFEYIQQEHDATLRYDGPNAVP